MQTQKLELHITHGLPRRIALINWSYYFLAVVHGDTYIRFPARAFFSKDLAISSESQVLILKIEKS